jgi:membrane protein
VYGSIGTILILMVVVYFNAMILLVGFELNVSIHSLKEKAHLRKIHDEESLKEMAK